jgi:PAS domain S-box-containing protein
MNTIEVSTGEVRVAQAPASLQCLALGSCVAVILYDEEHKVGGIAHVMLPSAIGDTKEEDLLKHANHCVRELVKQLRELGASEGILVARLVGGARVIPDAPDVGKENIGAVRSILKELNIRIVDEHLGGTMGRSALFDVATGELHINGKAVPVEETHPLLEKKKELAQNSSEYIAALEEKIVARTKELNDRVVELENVRKATFNLLEDLEKERDRLTESKTKVDVLVKDLEKFKLAVDNVSDNIIITDSEGIVIYANKAIEKITGYRPEEVVGKKSGALWKAPMPREYYEKLWDTIREQKKVFTGEIQNRRKNGEVYTASISISPILNEKGGIEFFVAIEHDVTKEKEMDKAKTEFVSLASHQLRTPLTSVSWYAEMLLAGDIGEMSPEQKKYINRVYHGNQRMVELVNSLLNVSRIELGIFSVDPKPTDIVALAQKVISEQTLQMEGRKINFISSFDKNIPIFSADPNLLRMIFQNLLANAVKYTPERGKIEFSLSSDGGKNVLLRVSDTGYGIPKIQQDKIFTKLFRADNVREKDTDGTGLGLYIVKSVIEHSGGGIRFESEENKGTTFYVTLPLEGMKKKEGTKALS